MDPILTTPELAQEFNVAEITLRKWRLGGTGPRFIRVGANIRYRRSDIDAWLASRTVSSTSERCGAAAKIEGAS